MGSFTQLFCFLRVVPLHWSLFALLAHTAPAVLVISEIVEVRGFPLVQATVASMPPQADSAKVAGSLVPAVWYDCQGFIRRMADMWTHMNAMQAEASPTVCRL